MSYKFDDRYTDLTSDTDGTKILTVSFIDVLDSTQGVLDLIEHGIESIVEIGMVNDGEPTVFYEAGGDWDEAKTKLMPIIDAGINKVIVVLTGCRFHVIMKDEDGICISTHIKEYGVQIDEQDIELIKQKAMACVHPLAEFHDS
jgi:hypothetical protein